MKEGLEYLFVACITQSNLVKIVLLHKAIEDIRTKNDCLWYLYLCIGEAIEVWSEFNNVIKECQATSLTS